VHGALPHRGTWPQHSARHVGGRRVPPALARASGEARRPEGQPPPSDSRKKRKLPSERLTVTIESAERSRIDRGVRFCKPGGERARRARQEEAPLPSVGVVNALTGPRLIHESLKSSSWVGLVCGNGTRASNPSRPSASGTGDRHSSGGNETVRGRIEVSHASAPRIQVEASVALRRCSQ